MRQVKNRNSLDILAAMLSASETASGKTHIMFGANLSYRLLERYLAEALRARLIAQTGQRSYGITGKGKAYLRKYMTYVVYRRALNNAEQNFQRAQSTLRKMCLEKTEGLSLTSAVSGNSKSRSRKQPRE